MESGRCPICDASVVILGHVNGGRTVSGLFVPRHVRSFRRQDGVPLDGSTFRCCASCGHVWARLKPEDLRAFIKEYGDELAKQDIEPIDAGPDHGWPDAPEARRARQGVAEIDALFRAEKQGEATRRYRELTGGTWDQAIDATRGWRGLTRGQKLALFGCRPKGKSPDGRAERLDHPMHDDLIDG